MASSPPAERVAAAVRAEMARRKISQQELADALGKSQAFVWRRLDGEVVIKVDELEAIARVLEVPVSVLIDDSAGAA